MDLTGTGTSTSAAALIDRAWWVVGGGGNM
jgi:hypothetical protein